MSLGFPWVGNLLQWKYLDPIGGMILSTYIIWQWCLTLQENFANRKQDLDRNFRSVELTISLVILQCRERRPREKK